ncbi:hypothetical protein ADM96_26200 [Burkholderia sp. ST111]|nr:hypothetical protein ADM96_26200 [Burkholderia sp. ST111]
MSTTGAVQNFIEATQRTFHSAPAIRAPFQQDDRIFRSYAGTRMGASPVMPVRLRIDENPSVTCLYVDNRARTARGAAIDYVTGMKVTHDRNRVHVEYLVAHEVRSSPCNTWIYEDQGTGRGAGYLPVAANVADGPGFGPRATQCGRGVVIDEPRHLDDDRDCDRYGVRDYLRWGAAGRVSHAS